MSEQEAAAYAQYVALRDSEATHTIILKNQLEDLFNAVDRKISEKPDIKKEDEKFNNQSESNIFEKFINNFSESMKSAYHLINIQVFSRSFLKTVYIEEKFFRYADKELDPITTRGDFQIFGVRRDNVYELQKSMREYDRLSDGADTLPSAVIMAMVALFDTHFSSLAKGLIKAYPKAAGLEDKTIDVSLILKAASIDELHQSIIDERIHSLMRGSHDEQISFIERFGRKIRDAEDYPLFLEIFERRNLAAHGEGRANKHYCDKCAEYRVPTERALKLGEKIDLSPKYLNESVDTLYQFGFLTSWWLWTKLDPQNMQPAYETAVHTSYDLLIENRFNVAEKIISSVLIHDSKNLFEVERRMLCINRAIALKSLDDDQWNVEVKRFGWDAVDARFKVAFLALNEDCDAVCALMPQLTDDDLIGEDGFRNWPVFKWVRRREGYQKAFFETFGSQLREKDEGQKDD